MEIEKILEDLRGCADGICLGCHLAGEDGIRYCWDILKVEAHAAIMELIADRDAWAERWVEEHNARLRAEENAADFNRIRNELCDRCGKYKEAYNGACKGCRWEK